ncbi:transcriptional regulator FeaR [Aquabacterium sp.]|uniref:transcriptional regulator FeaR n=1 Tax=Aquabacterium sp. TaxID=1872578 RepID=UPI0025C57E36|nr:transcriptional regulator FeaR [Aquabacterium sp.]
MKGVFSTDAVASQDRVAYWVDTICSTYVQLECEPLTQGPFAGHVVKHALPGLELSQVRASPQRVYRSPRGIARSGERCFIVSVQVKGRGLIAQDGREALLEPGDFAIYDSARPYTLSFSEAFEERCLKVHEGRLRELFKGADQVTATKVSRSSGVGRLLAQTMGAACQQADRLEGVASGAVSDAILSLLAGGLSTLSASLPAAPSALESYHLGRIRAFIAQNLGDGDLTVDRIAAHVGLSVAHVYRLFKSQTLSPSEYLWSERLARCRQDLSDPTLRRQSVSQIAFRWGFNDASHFSRAFRQHHGMSPLAWRRQALPA